jgi:hypothetical protein
MTTTAAPRGRKRSRSPLPPSASRLSKRTSSQRTESQLESLQSDITLKLTASPTLPISPRITVPLDIDVATVQLPTWIDMTIDYWVLWRHIYDKWRIQQKFANVNAVLHGCTKGLDLAHNEIDRLLYIRERLLTDHPDRQDINLRNRKTVKQVWRYLSKSQSLGEEVAKFSCAQVEREMRWDIMSEEDDVMWDQIGLFLIEQGTEGRIFIDPREYYNHYSWCIEDFGKDVSECILQNFYLKFAARGGENEGYSRETVDCDDCSAVAASSSTTEDCRCEETCLLCLPHNEGYVPISPISSLPSPPRTPGTQTLQSYFKGRRLSHPSLKEREMYTDDDAIGILLSFCGLDTRQVKRLGRSRSRR